MVWTSYVKSEKDVFEFRISSGVYILGNLKPRWTWSPERLFQIEILFAKFLNRNSSSARDSSKYEFFPHKSGLLRICFRHFWFFFENKLVVFCIFMAIVFTVVENKNSSSNRMEHNASILSVQFRLRFAPCLDLGVISSSFCFGGYTLF